MLTIWMLMIIYHRMLSLFSGICPCIFWHCLCSQGKHYDRSISEKEGDILWQIFVCIQIRSDIYLHAILTACFNYPYIIFTSVFFTTQLQIHYVISQWCVFLHPIPHWRWPKKKPKYVWGLLYDCILSYLTIVQLLE
jgi:hypothetical protein